MKKLLYIAGLVMLGCAGPPKGHIVRGVGTGTKFGITENPATQMYELGFTRFQIEVTTIPVMFATNKDGSVYPVVPDVQARYEIEGKNTIFGAAGMTSTLKTGSNSVSTLINGIETPINLGIGTNQLAPASIPK